MFGVNVYTKCSSGPFPVKEHHENVVKTAWVTYFERELAVILAKLVRDESYGSKKGLQQVIREMSRKKVMTSKLHVGLWKAVKLLVAKK